MAGKVSVVITCYNDGEFIEEAISSVENSLYKNTEIIIVDDCSTDANTQAVINKLAGEGYHVIRQKQNAGVGHARNTGAAAASGEYILPLDGDDRIMPDYLDKAVDIFTRNNNIGVVYCNVRRFGAKTTTRIAPAYNLPQLLAGNYIASCSVFKRALWQQTNGYDTNMPNYEDWEFWVTLAEKGISFYHINEVLFEYRARANSKISKCIDPQHRAKVVSYVVNKHKEIYSKHITEIVAYLHMAISGTEQQLQEQTALLSHDGLAELPEKLKFAEQELIRRTAYYENSIFWKLKKLVDKIKPGNKQR